MADEVEREQVDLLTQEEDPTGFREPRSWFQTILVWTMVITGMILGLLGALSVGTLAFILGDRHRRIAHQFLRLGHLSFVKAHRSFTYELTGLENLGGGPYIICPNHSSRSDIIYLYALPGDWKWMLKGVFRFVPLYGLAAWLAGYIFVERKDLSGATRLMRQVERYVRGGVSIINFPEGHRSLTGQLKRFFQGAARMAIVNQIPALPVGIVGTYNLLVPSCHRFPARSHVSIHVGTPIPSAGLEATPAHSRAFSRELREGILAAKREAQKNLMARCREKGWVPQLEEPRPPPS